MSTLILIQSYLLYKILSLSRIHRKSLHRTILAKLFRPGRVTKMKITAILYRKINLRRFMRERQVARMVTIMALISAKGF